MNEEEKYFYLAALDYRIHEANGKEDEADEIRMLTLDPEVYLGACPLCDAYWERKPGLHNCKNCPVSGYGDNYCGSTNYLDIETLRTQRQRILRRKVK